MKISVTWLKQHLDFDHSVEHLSVRLTSLGLEVDRVDNPAESLRPFIVAEIEHAEKHPDADRLKVCTVKSGPHKTQQVVCGAPNARAGIKVALANEGDVIPATGTKLKKSKIRGVESCGMLCSSYELGLADDSVGILELPDDAPVGVSIVEVLGLDDALIEIGLTPNRPDCAGMRGIARDLAASGFGVLRPLPLPRLLLSGPTDLRLTCADDAREACPHCMLRRISGVDNTTPSPAGLQKQLEAVGLKVISRLVDVTNFYSHDQCRPLHVFDADKVKGGIHISLARGSETFEALDGNTYTIPAGSVIISDADGVISLAGIMGGKRTSVTSETKNVLLECAWFEPNRIARTGRDLQILSDARYRFERGVDPNSTPFGLDQATAMILELCRGTACEAITLGAPIDSHRSYALPHTKVALMGGFSVPVDRQKSYLENIGCVVVDRGDRFEVLPPSWRPDILGAADLVEEILRLEGFDKIPEVSVLPDVPPITGVYPPMRTLAAKVQKTLAGRGFQECVTWSFMPRKDAERFKPHSLSELAALQNPISQDLDVLRPSIVPNLCAAALRNHAKGYGDVCLFEVGPVFSGCAPNMQTLVASGVRMGASAPRHWSGGHVHRHADFYDVKADVLAVLETAEFAQKAVPISRDAPEWCHPGRSAVVRLGKTVVATFGEIHPKILKDWDTNQSFVVFEVYLEAIPKPKQKSLARPLLVSSAFQPVQRDLAFVVANDFPAQDVLKVISATDSRIQQIEVFDVYVGKGIAEDEKSLAISFMIEDHTKTLDDMELGGILQMIINAVESKTPARLR